MRNNQKVVKSMPKKVIKDKITPCNSFVNENFIKVRPITGGTSYIRSVDVKIIDAIQFFVDPEKNNIAKDKTCWRINYAMNDGEEITDSTPYKSQEQAEKVAESILVKLPKPVPITSITNNISAAQEEPIYEENPNRQPVGFKLDGVE